MNHPISSLNPSDPPAANPGVDAAAKPLTPMSDKERDARAFLTELRREIETHPAVNHIFLNRLATSPFSRQDYRVFAENHYPLVCVFTNYLENLLVRAPDSEAKLWLAKVLVDEYGEGSEGKDHSTLYAGFVNATGGASNVQMSAPLAAPAQDFIRTHLTLVRKYSFLEGLGAVGPGHEWAIPKMFEAVIAGLRRAEFEEAEIEYFTLHVAQDGDHGSWLEEALVGYATTDSAREEIRRGALLSLEARAKFWSGVQQAVIRYRQPRAIRPDGPEGRSVRKELLLTAWDGMQWARVAEEKLRALLQRRRLTLSQVLAECRQLT